MQLINNAVDREKVRAGHPEVKTCAYCDRPRVAKLRHCGSGKCGNLDNHRVSNEFWKPVHVRSRQGAPRSARSIRRPSDEQLAALVKDCDDALPECRLSRYSFEECVPEIETFRQELRTLRLESDRLAAGGRVTDLTKLRASMGDMDLAFMAYKVFRSYEGSASQPSPRRTYRGAQPVPVEKLIQMRRVVGEIAAYANGDKPPTVRSDAFAHDQATVREIYAGEDANRQRVRRMLERAITARHLDKAEVVALRASRPGGKVRGGYTSRPGRYIRSYDEQAYDIADGACQTVDQACMIHAWEL